MKIFAEFYEDEWNHIKETCLSKPYSIKNRGEKRKFLCGFSDLITHKLQTYHNIDCTLRSVSNWFKTDGRKKNSPIWSGQYVCDYVGCRQKYSLVIQSESLPINLMISFEKLVSHERKVKTVRCEGEERKDQAKNLIAYGTANVRNENIIENHANEYNLEYKKKPENLSTLSVIKFEHVHRKNISRDMLTDVMATKKVFENIAPSESSIKGYIQEIICDPFGYLLFSDLQLKIWNQVKLTDSVWYFDATGNVHKKISGDSRRIFLYSIVCTDPANKITINIADWFTNNHTTHNISKYLISIKYAMNPKSSKEILNSEDFNLIPSLPRIIVVDFSWALINSVMESFNGRTFNEYLCWCYDILINKIKENYLIHYYINTRVVLCYVHFFKMIMRRIKKANVSKKLMNNFLFCLSLLMNSETIEDFLDIINHIYIVYKSKNYTDMVLLSISTLSKKLIERNLEKNDIELENSDFHEQTKLDGQLYFYKTEEMEKTIMSNSPFTRYFINHIEKIKVSMIISNESDPNSNPINEYHCPKLFDILNDYFYILPLWSNLIISFTKKLYPKQLVNVKTRLTNNPVETHTAYKKNKLLNKNDSLMPSEITSSFYNEIQAKYIRNYKIFYENDKNKEKIDKPCEEKWRKNTKENSLSKKRYLDPIPLLGQSKKLFIQMNPNYTKTQDINFNDSFNIPTTSKNSEIFKRMNNDEELSKIIFEKIEHVLASIQNANKFSEIQSILKDNKNLIGKSINLIRNITPVFSIKDYLIEDNSLRDILTINEIDNEFISIKTTGDGNCLYRSLSLLLFKTENNYKVVKLCHLSILNEYIFFFKKLQLDTSFEIFMETTSKENRFAKSWNILACSILLNKPIAMISIDEIKRTPYNQIYNLSTNDKYLLYLVHSEKGKHFSPILLKNEKNIKLPNITIDFYKNKKIQNNLIIKLGY